MPVDLHGQNTDYYPFLRVYPIPLADFSLFWEEPLGLPPFRLIALGSPCLLAVSVCLEIVGAQLPISSIAVQTFHATGRCFLTRVKIFAVLLACKCGLSFGPRGLVRSTGLGHICELVVQVKEQLIDERLLRPEFHTHESRFYSCLVVQ